MKNFRGIEEKEIEFAQGINVVFGPNESGKSSIAEAIFFSLFRQASKAKKKEGESFWRNRTNAPHIILEIQKDGRNFKIERNYSSGTQSIAESKSFESSHPEDIKRAISEELFAQDSNQLSLKDIEKLIENIFYIRQEKIKPDNFEESVKRFLGQQLSELRKDPFAVIQDAKKIQEEFSRGTIKAAKNPGIILRLNQTLEELRSKADEIRVRLTQYQDTLEELEKQEQEYKEKRAAREKTEKQRAVYLRINEELSKLIKAEEELLKIEDAIHYHEYYEKASKKTSEIAEKFKSLRLDPGKLIRNLEALLQISRLKSELLKTVNIDNETKQKERELEAIPVEIEQELKTAEDLSSLIKALDSLLKATQELKFEPEKLEEDIRKAEELDNTLSMLKESSVSAKAEILLKSSSEVKVKADGEFIAVSEGLNQTDFSAEFEVEHPELQVKILLSDIERAKKIKAFEHELNQILKAYLTESVGELKKLLIPLEDIKLQRAVIENKLKELNLLKSSADLSIDASLKDTLEKKLRENLEKFGCRSIEELRKKLERRKALEHEINSLRKTSERQEPIFDDELKKTVLNLLDAIFGDNKIEELYHEIKRDLEAIKDDLSNKLAGARLLADIAGLKLEILTGRHEIEKTDQSKDIAKSIELLKKTLSEKANLPAAIKMFIDDLDSVSVVQLLDFKNLQYEVERTKAILKQAEDLLETLKDLSQYLGKKPDIASKKTIDELKDEKKELIRNADRIRYRVIQTIKENNIRMPEFFISKADLEDLNSIKKLREEIENTTKQLEKDRDRLVDDERELGEKLNRNRAIAENIPDASELINIEDLIETNERKLKEAKKILSALNIIQRAVPLAQEKYFDSIIFKIIENANELFSRITGEKYRIEYKKSQKGEGFEFVPVLKEGIEFSPEELSQGTKDQFYLCLRLAAGIQFSNNIVFPLLVDDTFSDFDEQRLKTTIESLASLIKNDTLEQAIIFTCHENVIKLAEEGARKQKIDFKLIRFEPI